MKKSLSIQKTIRQYGIITLACVAYAVAIAVFLDPHALAPGGVSGLAIVLSSFIPLDTGVIILLFNIPLLIIGTLRLGKSFAVGTIYATVVSSLMITGMNAVMAIWELPLPSDDLLLNGVIGGALQAVGIGVIFRCGATTGGTDIIIRLLLLRHRHLHTGMLFMCIDSSIIALSAIVSGSLEIALYAALSLVVSSYLIDRIMYGPDTAKFLIIITDHATEVISAVFEKYDIGMTRMNGRGAYTGEGKEVILCAIKKPLAPYVCDIVHTVDKKAFVIVTDAAEVHGEGFQEMIEADQNSVTIQ
ncbi:MAG: YitT family protein [Clostridiales bacterium]|nr:YitT family protein [Clostridiales bacterium]MDD7773760.1 YitT family protein [Eubacteriales bacterium]